MEDKDKRILNAIDRVNKSIELLYSTKRDLYNDIGGYNRYKELYIEDFKEKLKVFVKDNVEFANFHLKYNENMEVLIVIWNINNKDIITDEQWNKLFDFESSIDDNIVLFKTK